MVKLHFFVRDDIQCEGMKNGYKWIPWTIKEGQKEKKKVFSQLFIWAYAEGKVGDALRRMFT